ncbi:efflux RND transporter permease subunit [Anaeromyxobacter diazotrophicus]|uniref:RND transporter n=1 Tax=Anaeromyxobacter diazotrophicus TaxID=2590199 RepID=A0A7I9VHK1_9BACT|nr:efflux RND transporter permease subunit [Anaeromyxobacter diazotrophicus]GEJ55815.1 RND transporter [Anaeromyxobacter diazotrophicus]
MWLTRMALRNPVFILMLSLMTLALGWISLQHLAVDLFPNIDIPVVRVATFYTGAAPEDVEKSITVPIERAVSASPGVDRVESTSKQGFSAVSVWFQYGTNLDNAQFDVSQRISQILNTLPPGIQQPFVLKFDVTNIPVLAVAMTADGLDEKQLYDLAYNVVEPQLERLPGVASATVAGGKTREIEVMVHRDALRARGLGILDVVNAVRSSNLLLPSGDLKAGVRDYNVFSNTQFGEAKPLRDVVVQAPPARTGASSAAPVRVRDVARVVDGAADQSEIVRVNGSRGVFFRVLKQPGANTVAVVDAVKAAMPRLRDVPPNVKLAISFDQSQYIRAAIGALQHEALQGGALAVLVILVFLVSFSATGIIAVAIPLSIVATFVLLYFSGQTLNVFTLGGLALGVGRLVDDSIVELENIHRHLALGQDRRTAVLNAAQEVAGPIFVSTITTIVVFFPVVFLGGVAKNLFLPLALTIAFALIMSFFVSRTVTPLLCLKYLRAEHPGRGRGYAAWITARFDALDEAYARALRWVLRRRGLVIGGIALTFVGSLFLGRFIGTEFFPQSDESQFQVIYKTPIGTRVELTEQVTKRIEATVLRELGAYKSASGGPVTTTLLSDTGLPLGRSALFSANTGPHSGNLSVNLVPHAQRALTDDEATDVVRKVLRKEVPGTQVYYFTGGIVKRILNFGTSAPIDVEISGYDLEAGSAYAKRLKERLQAELGRDGRALLADLQISREENYPELDVEVDREKAGMLGVTEQQVAQSVLTSLVGSNQFSPIPFTDAKTGNQYYINVRLDDAYRSKVSDLGDVYLRAPSGKVVALANLAKVKRSSGPVTIDRKYLQRIVDVTANLPPGVDLGSASAAVERAIHDVPPPDGFTARLGGQTAAQREAFSGLIFAALLAVALVYMILASQFRSLVDPLVIMFSVPMGITGVIVMLLLTGTSLSVNSFMGVIMMVGIVVSNGVLLVDFARVLQSRGQPLLEATVQAGKTRLRPILMTTIATIVGLVPMALGIGEGSETNLPLARAVIGGLTVSTFFTLFLIPALYTLLERFSKPQHEEPEPAAEVTP